MDNCVRKTIKGASQFFTLSLRNRKSRLLIEEIEFLRQAFREVRDEMPFTMEASVVLPEHLHCLWTLPGEDREFSLRLEKIKSAFLRRLYISRMLDVSHIEKERNSIWNKDLYLQGLLDKDDLVRHIEYIHYNPVKHGHVRMAREWPYSSFHRYVREGRYAVDWTYYEERERGGFGE